MKIGLVGLEGLAKRLEKQLIDEGIDAKFIDSTENIFSELKKIDILHVVYNPSLKYTIIAKLLGKKVVRYWVGSDVLKVISSKKTMLKAKFLNFFTDKHLATSEILVKELKSIGIDAEWLPIVPENLTPSIEPFPDKFTVLSYLPDDRRAFYGSKIIYKLAEEFPNIRFLVVAGTAEKQKKMQNIEYLGWQEDMELIYRQSTVLIRMTEHDGLSKMVLEALAHGRQVIRSYEFPYCYYARDYAEVKSALLKIMENPVLNYEGAKYVQDNFNAKKWIAKLINIYNNL